MTQRAAPRVRLGGSALRQAGTAKENDMNITAVTPELLAECAQSADLDRSLSPLFGALDPDNDFDLGGLAGIYFHRPISYIAPMDNGLTDADAPVAWPYLDTIERRTWLQSFVAFAARMYA